MTPRCFTGLVTVHKYNLQMDRYSDEQKKDPYYEVKIETEQDYFERGIEKYYMYPGTQVMAMIEIGSRTIADYILEPITGNFSRAMSEK